MFILKFSTDNAAFDGDLRTEEIARILRQIADRIEGECREGGRIYDQNGNGIGTWVTEGIS